MSGNRIKSKSFCKKISGGQGSIIMSKQSQDMSSIKGIVEEYTKTLLSNPLDVFPHKPEYTSITEINTSDAKGSMIEFVLNKKHFLKEELGHQDRVQNHIDYFIK